MPGDKARWDTAENSVYGVTLQDRTVSGYGLVSLCGMCYIRGGT